MRIASVATALPDHRFDQKTILAAIKEVWGPRLERPGMLDRLHARAGVQTRSFVLPLADYLDLHTWGQVNDVWIREAQRLGERAICTALSRAGLAKEDLAAIFFVSITGVSSPSIDALLVNRMGLSRSIKRVPIFGLGCVGGAAAVARAADYVRAFPGQAAVALSVELCSITIQKDDLSVANQISSGLFGDGAAAVIVTGSDVDADGPEILDTRSSFYPDTGDVMGWHISERGFRIVLSPEVPQVIREHLGGDVDAFLAAHGLERKDIGAWVMHTGGPAVLDATAASLGLPREALDASWQCLRQVGNLSSASVLFVLEEFLGPRRPPRGAYGVLAAMGPAFCAELVLLRW
jgi:alkylresorcinol/alkylpyrone synthase